MWYENRHWHKNYVMHYLPPLAAPSTTGLVLAGHLLGEGDKRHQEGHKHQRCTGPLHCQPRVISHMETAQYAHHDRQSTGITR